MTKFRNLINESEINESFSSAIFKKIAVLDQVRNSLTPGKVIPKRIIRELGSGYEKDFKKIDELLTEAMSILEEIQMDAEEAGI